MKKQKVTTLRLATNNSCINTYISSKIKDTDCLITKYPLKNNITPLKVIHEIN